MLSSERGQLKGHTPNYVLSQIAIGRFSLIKDLKPRPVGVVIDERLCLWYLLMLHPT